MGYVEVELENREMDVAYCLLIVYCLLLFWLRMLGLYISLLRLRGSGLHGYFVLEYTRIIHGHADESTRAFRY